MFALLPTILLLAAVLVVIAIVLRRLPAVTIRNEEKKQFSPTAEKSRRSFWAALSAKISGFFRSIAHYANSAKEYRPKITYLERMGKAIKLPSVERFRNLRKREFKQVAAEQQGSPAAHHVDSVSKTTDPEEQHFIDIIAHKPGDVRAYESLGKIYLDRKKFNDALEVYQFLTNHDASNGNYFSRLGLTKFNLGDYAGAISAYEKSVELEPHKPIRLINLGLSYEAAGDILKAISAIEQALAVVPENTQYLGILADLLEKNGQFETTAAVLEKILQLEPTNQAVRDRLMKLRY